MTSLLMITGSVSDGREYHHTPAASGPGTGQSRHAFPGFDRSSAKTRRPHASREDGHPNTRQPLPVRWSLACIRAYQLFISPLFPPCCRFTPTCSAYAREAILSHGFGRGLRLALSRLLRCHPFGGGGYDPVP